MDGTQNGDETDVDCGGRCMGCAIDDRCEDDGDCTSGTCASGRCAEPVCDDGVMNGDESDVDCGGSCDACAEGFDCGEGDDCLTGICSSGRCVAPTCTDGIIGGDETDVDCGGSCGPCAVGEGCTVAADCREFVCTAMTCAAPACDDGIINGAETAVDCGGSVCGGCAAGEVCDGNGDCESSICSAGSCAQDMCPDGVLNGDETDLDCGGPGCPTCADGDMCDGPSDCTSGVCTGGVCIEPMCPDGVLNGDETDEDCGGPGCPACGNGDMCAGSSDCTSGVCDSGMCVGAMCTDDVTNGMETDEDCGGPDCAPCGDGLMCDGPSDCTSGVCTGGVCIEAMCPDGVLNGMETDLDCGGPGCPTCGTGEMCDGATDCTSGVCTSGACVMAMCPDGVLNGTETDVDCGGPGCPSCDVGDMCGGATDCVSGVCASGACVMAMCPDGVLNGDETDVDCGGPGCPGCDTGDMCDGPSDCASGVCTGGMCVMAMCPDGVLNGTETDVDCGGPGCPTCDAGDMCAGATDCTSGVCTSGACAMAMCPDGVLNGDETDVDCGGPGCPDCLRGDMCDGAGDCATDGCVGGVCVIGPTAGFTVSPMSGSAPLMVAASSSASVGDAAISTTEYDFGEGGGFETTTDHSYATAGTYTVTQRVTDANGFVDTTTRTVTVNPAVCLLSATDKSPDSDLLLTSDMLGAEFWTLSNSGVRSDCAIAPGSGVFYYEGTIAPYDCDPSEAPEGCYNTPYDLMNFGVATSDSPLTEPPGGNATSFGVETSGTFFFDGYLGNVPADSTESYGFVVDYRGATPIVHLITGEYGTPAVVHSQTMTGVDTDLYAMIGGTRRKVGVEAQVNFGNDTTNHPFDFDPVAALTAAGLTDEASALVLGFGATGSQPANALPTLSVSADLSVALGSPVNLTGTATDAEDGDLSAGIYWEDLSTVYGSRTDGMGGSFSFTPTQLGLHPVRATVIDSDGGRRYAVVRVTVTGTLPQFDPVELVNDTGVDPNVGSGITTDGLGAKWTISDKMGIRANQGLYGEFWYFEVTRNTGPVNQGAGLVIWEGDLDPYSADNVPPSISINTSGGVWQNIIYYQSFDTVNTNYGFAVDYRGDSPIVYVIMGDTVVAEWTMVDTFVPVHPMLYGNLTGDPAMYDEVANFGATAFTQDPCMALSNYGLSAPDVAAFEVGWGDANTVFCP